MTLDKSPETIQTMFNLISERYDSINDIMSFGTQISIKKDAIKLLDIQKKSKVLDLCCGTGDLSNLINKNYPESEIIGIDFSDKMLEIAKNKNNKVNYFQGDATRLPFADNMFDYVVMGFGLRNIQNAEKAVDEVFRVLKQGGKFLHLDFGKKNLPDKIFDNFVLTMSNFLSENKYAYKYLIQSKKEFLTPKELIKDFESKGFKFLKRKDYLFGVISCQILVKP